MKTPSNPGLRRTYVNLKRANWNRYRQEVEAALSKRFLPTDCQRDEKIFRTVLLKAASHHIPTVRHRLHEEAVPAEILDVMNRRDDLRKRDHTSPELQRLNKTIQNLRAVFCTICSLSMFVSDALGDHMVEAYSSTGLVIALYVASMVSLCLPHLVEVRTFSMLIVLRALVAARSMCLL